VEEVGERFIATGMESSEICLMNAQRIDNRVKGTLLQLQEKRWR